MSAITTTFGNNNPANSTDAFSSLSSDEFLQIIFTEIQNQDPLDPQDTSATIEQLSNLRSIESDTKISESLERLVSRNELAAASNLIGSLVSGISLTNERVADLVISVTQTDEGPILNLFGGHRVFFDQVDEVIGPLEEAEDEPPVDDGTDDPVDGVDDGTDDDGTTDGVDDGTDDDGTEDDGTVDDGTGDDDPDEPAP